MYESPDERRARDEHHYADNKEHYTEEEAEAFLSKMPTSSSSRRLLSPYQFDGDSEEGA